MPNKLLPKVKELVDWCYSGEDPCTPKETQKIVADFWGPVHYNTICNHKPDVHKRILQSAHDYYWSPKVHDRILKNVHDRSKSLGARSYHREYNYKRMQPKWKETWQHNRETAARYLLTEKGKSFLGLGNVADGGFENGSMMRLLYRLSICSANPYELVDWQREAGYYGMKKKRGMQLIITKSVLRRMEKNNLVMPE
jgi:hypothetical protein